ncbi:MAG: DUF2892 domain-containing protein [Phormidesmis sp.]
MLSRIVPTRRRLLKNSWRFTCDETCPFSDLPLCAQCGASRSRIADCDWFFNDHIFPWLGVALPRWFSWLLSAFGLLWMMTGLVSRCGMYFLLGFLTAKRRSLSNDTDVEQMRFKDKNDG